MAHKWTNQAGPHTHPIQAVCWKEQLRKEPAEVMQWRQDHWQNMWKPSNAKAVLGRFKSLEVHARQEQAREDWRPVALSSLDAALA